ncbi:hypothetical protein HPP92_001543 [Vanilla planifolia]|uniref:Peptidase C14 caspase domain-containing protein n=1 Tax=Vanilla planifolia TaxID=51239 RepID=A0A835S027_VANPL|nr:hypothetical protein HPP92_001543 [Vanilla planifolia]
MALILPISAFQAPAHHVCCIPFLPLAPTYRSTPFTISTKIPTLCFRHCKLALVVSAMGDGETELPVSGRGLEEEEKEWEKEDTERSLSGESDEDVSPQDYEYVSQIKRVLELLKKNRDMLFGEIKLTIMIEDPRDVEQKKLFGIEDPTKLTRDDMVAALEDVHEGRIPKNRVALQLLAQEMLNWPELELKKNRLKVRKTAPFCQWPRPIHRINVNSSSDPQAVRRSRKERLYSRSRRRPRMVKKAVLIGCNYPGTKAELKGCVNDVRRMHRCLVERYGFDEGDIEVLIDTDRSFTQPTGANIRSAISRLIRSAKPGDFLFVHYSGHGTRVPAETGDDDDTGFDECIVPCDMNLITDDDFRELVDDLPKGCRLTVVSDSCHSGGLIQNVKEQIGESTKRDEEQNESEFSFSSFLKHTVHNALESRGIDIPLEGHDHHHRHRHHRHTEEEETSGNDVTGRGLHFRNRSLPLSTLVEILKQKTGKEDIDVGNIRPTLFDMFGEDASPKVKKFMKVLLQKFGVHGSQSEGGGDGGFMGLVGGLAIQFVKQKLGEHDENYAEPAMKTKVGSKEEVYAGAKNRALPKNGILISGCQSDQTSADANPTGSSDGAYGALSNAIQTILAQSDGNVGNRELVLTARKVLSRQGFKQQPGLYCSDDVVDEPFVC